MPFKPPRQQPEFADLLISLAQSNLKKKDESTWQTIDLIIKRIMQFQELINADVDTLANIFKSATFVTQLNEQTKLPASRQLTAGAGISIHANPNGKIVVNTAIPLPDLCCGEEGGLGQFAVGGGGSGAGSAGPPGPAGPTGPQGSMGPPGLESYQEDILFPIVLPGPTGATGPQGIQGIQGLIGPPGFDGEEAPEPFLIPGPKGDTGAAGAAGATTYLQSSFTVTTGNWRDHVKELQMTGANRATIQGTGRLSIRN